MIKEAADMGDIMRIAENFRDGDGRQTIVAVEMQDNWYIRDGYT